jgi:hypothetical protein
MDITDEVLGDKTFGGIMPEWANKSTIIMTEATLEEE